MTTRRQSIAKPPMEDSYGRLHINIDVHEIKQVVNILHIYHEIKIFTFILEFNLTLDATVMHMAASKMPGVHFSKDLVSNCSYVTYSKVFGTICDR